MERFHHTIRTPGPLALLLTSSLLLAGLTATPSRAWAVVLPDAITYEGRLTGTSGKPLSGTLGMKFGLYSTATGTTSLADWTFLGVPISKDGNFRVELGGKKNDVPRVIRTNKDLYLEISIQGPSGLQTLSPRIKLGATARAQHAQHAENGAPVGTIMAYGGIIPPNGWLLCDGKPMGRFDPMYNDLFKVIGNSFGAGDGSTTFNLPDLRGRFLRGVDSGTGRDPDASKRKAMNPGGKYGDKVGSVQGTATSMPTKKLSNSSVSNHGHGISGYSYGGGGSGNGSFCGGPCSGGGVWGPYSFTKHSISGSGGHSHSISGGDKESRPTNANVNFIIKY